jgi:hypothetical protein
MLVVKPHNFDAFFGAQEFERFNDVIELRRDR